MTITGEYLSENKLRTFLKCSQLYKYGNEEILPFETLIFKFFIEYIYSYGLRKPDYSMANLISIALPQTIKHFKLQETHLEGQIQEIERLLMTWINTFLSAFPIKKYMTLTGPLPYRVKVSSTVIDLDYSVTLKKIRKSGIELISFSPYEQYRDHMCDPVTHIKLYTMKEFANGRYNQPRAILHTLYIYKKQLKINTITDKEINPEYLNMITNKIKDLENEHYFPLIPCPYKCKYIEYCMPGAKL